MGPYSDMLQLFNQGQGEGKPLILFCTDRGAKMTRAAKDVLNGVGVVEPEDAPVQVKPSQKRKG